jgi:hypothetical protein
MDTDLLIVAFAFISVTAIIAKTVIRMQNARLSAGPSDELKERVEELENTVHGLQQELAEAQERLDFAERLLAKGTGQM